jgi:hypothetical protein
VSFLLTGTLRYLQLNVFLSPHIFLLKIIQLRERAFSLHSYFVLHAKISLYFDQIETALKSLFKSFPYWYCSSMTVPAATQPNIQPGLSNQTHIALNLFDTILKTANTREESHHTTTFSSYLPLIYPIPLVRALG